MNLRAIKTVLSYYMPEVRAVIDKVVAEYPHDVFLQSIDPGLDDFHEPVIDKLVEYYADTVPALKNFPYRYPIMGSEEGIKEFMTLLQSKRNKEIYVFPGEYEGYGAVAESRKQRVLELPFAGFKHYRQGIWFVSNPSAINGDVLPDGLIHDICSAGHKVFYDLTYLGTTRPTVYDLSHENILSLENIFASITIIFPPKHRKI